jgi:asparagine synthase (glutamine-hydrolysing)
MCGIAGLIDFSPTADRAGLSRRARAMAEALAYRGPDGFGEWIDPEAPMALAHRRLAIVDLTPTGAQPMVSSNGRWVITYNGEV